MCSPAAVGRCVQYLADGTCYQCDGTFSYLDANKTCKDYPTPPIANCAVYSTLYKCQTC